MFSLPFKKTCVGSAHEGQKHWQLFDVTDGDGITLNCNLTEEEADAIVKEYNDIIAKADLFDEMVYVLKLVIHPEVDLNKSIPLAEAVLSKAKELK